MWSNRVAWAFLAPTLIILAITGLLPFFYVLYVGFFDWNVFAADPTLQYAGANNYRRLMFDEEFLKSLWATARFTFWAVGSELVLGFLLANLLTREFWGKAFFRTIHALPIMVAPIAVGAVWRLMVIPGFGPVPFFLDRWFEIDYNIGTYANHAFFTTVLMDIWHWTPLVTLTMLAGLSAMPREPLEAALVDGASRWQIFRFVTIPGCSLAVVLVQPHAIPVFISGASSSPRPITAMDLPCRSWSSILPLCYVGCYLSP